MKLNKDITAHIIAFALIIGFFATIFTILLGFIDIKDPVVVSFAGTMVGYCAGNVAPVAKFYFGTDDTIKQHKKEDNEQSN